MRFIEFNASKALLASRTEYYNALFGGGYHDSTDNVLEIKENSYDCFNAFLRYIYTDQTVLSHEYAVELLMLATGSLPPSQTYNKYQKKSSQDS